MKAQNPLLVAVASGAGTLFALSLVLIFVSEGLPQSLYDFSAITRAINNGNVLHPMLALVSLVGYFEAGFLSVLLRRWHITPARNMTLVDVVGQTQTSPAAHASLIAGARTGVLAALLGLGGALPFYLYMTNLAFQNGAGGMENNMAMGEAAIGGVVTLVIGIVSGVILGAIGGRVGASFAQKVVLPSGATQ